MSKKVYISGPIVNRNHFNLSAFLDAAGYARFKGFTPVVPHDVADNLHYQIEMNLNDFRKKALAELLLCNEVWMLPNWNESTEATYEKSVADQFQIPVKFYDKLVAEDQGSFMREII